MKSLDGTFLDPKDTTSRTAAVQIELIPELLDDKSYLDHVVRDIKTRVGIYLVDTIPYQRWTLIHLSEEWPSKAEMEYAKHHLNHRPVVKMFIEYGAVHSDTWRMATEPEMLHAVPPAIKYSNKLQHRLARFIASIGR